LRVVEDEGDEFDQPSLLRALVDRAIRRRAVRGRRDVARALEQILAEEESEHEEHDADGGVATFHDAPARGGLGTAPRLADDRGESTYRPPGG
jgi:hypothetical protein